MARSSCALILLSCFVQLLLLLLLPHTDAAPDWISPEILEMIKTDKVRCMAEHGTTETMIDETNAGNLVDDRAITCYMYCLFESFGLVDEEANIEIEMMSGLLPEHIQSSAIETLKLCASKTGSDVCNRIYNIAQCVQDLNPGLWFML